MFPSPQNPSFSLDVQAWLVANNHCCRNYVTMSSILHVYTYPVQSYWIPRLSFIYTQYFTHDLTQVMVEPGMFWHVTDV